jgi:hypothetical protein
MWCPRCGSETDSAARFCSSCGQDLVSYQQLWQSTGSSAPGQPAPGQPAQVQQTPPPYQAPQYQQPSPQGQPPHIPNHLGWAIAALLLTFWPTGIVAVVYATQVDSKLTRGDVAGAWESSRNAKTWCWVSLGVAVALFVLVFLFLLFFGLILGSAEIN